MALASRLRNPAVIAAGVVAVITMFATIGYAQQRTRDVTSSAQLVLLPTGKTPDVRTQQLQTFSGSGVQGTFVEYLSSIRVPGGTLDVRAVPDSRVIDLTVTRLTGARAALDRVIGTALLNQGRMADDWAARRLSASSAEVPAGPSSTVLLAAGALLALLAGLATFAGVRALLREVAPPAGATEPAPLAREDEVAGGSDPAAWPEAPAERQTRFYARIR